jgi:hypothetical protein
MKMNFIIEIIILFFISFIKCEPSFTIREISHMETMCVLEKGYFQFVFIGSGSGISNGMKIILPLKSPETCKQAECTVTNDKMVCIMDAYRHDLSGNKVVEVYEEEPKINNFRIPNWKEYFVPERRYINHATNCVPNGKPSDVPEVEVEEEEEEEEEPVKENNFAQFEIKNIQILGCFRKKNNFYFQLSKIKDENSILSDTLDQEIYFEMNLKKPKNEAAICVIPKKNKNEEFTLRCAMNYGGEIEILEEFNVTIKVEDKDLKIIFKGSSIKPTNIDECTEKNLFASFEVENIEILGCFRNKNNFNFILTKEEDENSILKDTLEQDVYFEISFKRPKNETAFCVIPQINKTDNYTVRCAMEYGGELEIGGEANGVVNLEGKDHRIVFKGLSVPSTVVDECIYKN